VASLQPRGHHDHLVLYTFLPLLPTTCHCCYGTVLFDNFTRNTMIHGVFASSSISRENASAKGGPIRRPHRLIAFAAIGWILTPMKCIPGDVLNPSDCFNKPLPIYWILMSQSIIEFRLEMQLQNATAADVSNQLLSRSHFGHARVNLSRSLPDRGETSLCPPSESFDFINSYKNDS
jgi:hypothetical protein